MGFLPFRTVQELFDFQTLFLVYELIEVIMRKRRPNENSSRICQPLFTAGTGRPQACLRKTKTGRKDALLMAHKLRSDVTIERYQIDRDDYISSTVFLTIPKSGVFPAARMLASYKPLK